MTSSISRRQFLASGATISLAFLGLRSAARAEEALAVATDSSVGYGPLVSDPYGVLDLPEGFQYRVISRVGQAMDDGLLVPAAPDGMGTFAGPDGLTLIVRNHECTNLPRQGPFGWTVESLDLIDPTRIYDRGFGTRPVSGGTTTLVYDTRTGKLQSQYLSIAGTARNCAGGVTPWGSWLTCEEFTARAGDEYEQDHGWVFEVPASATPSLADPIPLKAMGRFNHEAVAVDPDTGIVYLTEDRGDGLFYRFIPNRPGELIHGGRLQALVVRDQPSADTRNWVDEDTGESKAPRIEPNSVVEVTWIDLDEVEAPAEDLRQRGHAAGAARFARGEGMWYGHESVFFACTNGGAKNAGQIWRYVPSRFEGRPEEQRFPGRLELFIEADGTNLIQNADNITIAPWGDVIVCEDSGENSSIVGVTPEGRTYMLADNVVDSSEFAGATFSPDGSTLFVNMQWTGVTLAITGPWQSARQG